MGSNNKESDTHVDAYSDRYRDAGSIPAASMKDILVVYARCTCCRVTAGVDQSDEPVKMLDFPTFGRPTMVTLGIGIVP